MTDFDVVVIGAGLAGLVAARDLALTGSTVLHLEARDRVGGRTWTKPKALGDLTLDMGGMWIEPAGQPRILAELQRYGLFLEPATGDFSVANHWHLGGEVRRGVLPVSMKERMQLERVVAAVVTDAARIASGVPLSDQDVTDLDVSVADYMGRLGLGPDLNQIAVTVPALTSCGFEPNATILHSLRLMGPAGGLYGYLGAGMQTITTGMSSLTAAIAEDSRAEMHLSEPVTSVDLGATPTVHTAVRQYTCGAIILAVPYGLIKSINFVDGPPAALITAIDDRIDDSGQYAEGTKIWAIVRGLPDAAIGISPEPGMRYFAGWEDLGDGTTLAVGFARSSDPLDGDDPDAVQSAARRLFPDVQVLDSCGHNWILDPHTGPTWPGFPPGWLTRHDRRMTQPFGPMVLATSDFAIEWPGNMEGAIESGLNAVDVVRSILDTEAHAVG